MFVDPDMLVLSWHKFSLFHIQKDFLNSPLKISLQYGGETDENYHNPA